FQAEDGIRDGHVTGVQTCALPIFHLSVAAAQEVEDAQPRRVAQRLEDRGQYLFLRHFEYHRSIVSDPAAMCQAAGSGISGRGGKIGRASCRERVEVTGRRGTMQK